ncbi:MAG: SusC/RagA family TonB-linked outer membrane protein [Saprospiraceae bacterium]|nr:SusC/RagA family TonB-linked outer membrane protein [Saprospiraceae bacterium]
MNLSITLLIKGLKHAALIVFFGIVGLAATYAQQTITGTVVDESGAPLVGVTIFAKGTNVGTVTDADGAYTINASSGQDLEFSMVGMSTQTVLVNRQTTINITLGETAYTLNEAVVTALGIKEDRRKLSYSHQSVQGEELANTQRDNAFLSLQGRVAGLNLTPTSGLAGGSVSINLRGVNSIGSSNQPLVVLDGLPINSGTFNQHDLYSDRVGVNGNVNNNRDDTGSRLAELNPNDIESVTVLKGPEAAALYGNEGANGVIVITTRKGKAGVGRVSYKVRAAMSELYLFPEIQQVYGRGVNGKDDPNATSYFGPQYASGTTFYNNVEDFFGTGSNSRHDLSFEGGTDKLTYRLSSALLQTEGVIPGNSFDQINASLTSEAKLLPWLKAFTRFSFTQNTNLLPPGGTDGYLTGTLRYPSDQEMSDYLTLEGTRRLTKDNLTPVTDNANPFFDVNKNVREERTDRTIGNITLDATIKPWWTVTGIFGADIYATNANRFFHPESNIGFPRAGWIENYTNIGRLLTTNMFTTLRKAQGNLRTSLVVGVNVNDRESETNSIYGEKFFLPDFNSVNNADPTTQRNQTIISRARLIGVFGKAEVNWQNWLIFNLTGRNDWSSTLPEENRSYFYPSAGLTLVFTDIPALQEKLSFMDFGKIRASFAQVGNPAPPYRIRARLVPRTSTGGGFSYDFFGDNPALKPEQVESFEVGTDLSFFKNRLSIDIAVFSKTIRDQIVTQRLSYGTGFIFGLLNGGELNTSGVEVQLGLVPFRTKNFTWNINANFTKYDTEVISLPAGVNEYYDSDTWAYGNARASAFSPADVLAARFTAPGNRYYAPLNDRGAGSATAIGGWSYLRNSKGQILINPTTGFPIPNNNFLPIGDRNPDFTMGLINDFRIMKNLSVSFLLDIRRGGDIFNGNELFLTQNGLSNRTLDRETSFIFAEGNSVLRDGNEETDNPTPNDKVITPNANQQYYTNVLLPEDFIERDINWLRLRDLTISYNFTGKWLGQQKVIKELSVFVNGTDLFLITNYSGADPYVSTTNPATGGAGGFGMDFGKISLPRTFSTGLSVSF